MVCVYVIMVRVFIERGVFINVVDFNERILLYYVVLQMSFELVELFISCGVSKDFLNVYGEFFFDVVQKWGCLLLILCLIFDFVNVKMMLIVSDKVKVFELLFFFY